jgi:hypothetical protein
MAYGYSADSIIEKVVTLVGIVLLFAALTPTVLSAFLNLSGSGIALATIFGTVMGLVFAAFVLKTVFKVMK